MRSNIEIVNKLMDCAATCEYCATACLNEEDVNMMRDCILLDRDCADICRLTGILLSRDSFYANEMLGLCAEACRRCADECARHENQHCQDCAKECSECEQMCLEVAD